MNIPRSTEIGDPSGRIPTAQGTHNQLSAAQSELAAAQKNDPSDASSQVHGVPRTHTGNADASVSTSERGHRNSNYAPGYEGAADAVRQRSYNAEEHRPSLLAHEPVTPLTEVPPDLGNNTQQTSSTQGPGMIPGPSIGQKAKAPFAKIHVSSHSLSACIHASVITQLTYPKGCWRGAPGKPRRCCGQLHGRYGQAGQGRGHREEGPAGIHAWKVRQGSDVTGRALEEGTRPGPRSKLGTEGRGALCLGTWSWRGHPRRVQRQHCKGCWRCGDSEG